MSSEKSSVEQATGAVNPEGKAGSSIENKQNSAEQSEIEMSEADLPHVEQTEGAEDAIDALREELVKAEEKAAESWDTLVRLQAEMDNQRKRTEKQVSDAHKFAIKSFVEQLLPVIDSLEMGLQAKGDLDSIREGMNLTLKQFESLMQKQNLQAVNPLGEKFDPELHQAMAMQPSEEYEDGLVAAVMQKGYTLNGRLVRPAMVMVAKNG
ncbi:MAG TPA: nucleotide exchange factor GrpE [Leucothrix mucor]|uniref:Protein GrpE n=1 Tax=Leucothrix mucor TaxID=45248 RepID=A0A7V2WVX7_LEUMU|nr:nucleotide exchange factor GrpE [Leucothrix mucor]